MISQISGRVSHFLLVCLFALTVERNQEVDQLVIALVIALVITLVIVLVITLVIAPVIALLSWCCLYPLEVFKPAVVISTSSCVPDCQALEAPEDHCECKVCYRKLPHYIHFKFCISRLSRSVNVLLPLVFLIAQL